jgi:hypothetical protein
MGAQPRENLMRVKLVAVTTTLVVVLLSAACGTPDETGPAGTAPAADSAAHRTDHMEASNKFGYQDAPDTRSRTERKRAKAGYYEDYDYQYERYGFGYHSDHCGDLLACYRLEGRGY